MKTILPLVILFFSFSCDSKRNKSAYNKADEETAINSKKTDNESNPVTLESFDTTIAGNFHLQAERFKLGDDRLAIINIFKGNKPKDVLDDRNYAGTGIVFNGDTIRQINKNIPGVCTGNSFVLIPVFAGDSLFNPEGFNYKKIITANTEYRILTGWYYNCNCNGRIDAAKAILVVRTSLNPRGNAAFLIGMNTDSVDLEKTSFTAYGNTLEVQVRLMHTQKIVVLELLGNTILVNGGLDPKLFKGAIFCIK